ncbi:MAG TPA: DUF2911 domain-containing protein [Candidatus Didemnitutus sp.]|nr:DUF2911 domain-containing protein [Candidatus Didemnitutus sp.]
MKIRHVLAVALTAAFLGVTLLPAQIAPPRTRVSPHETISSRIDGNRVTIVYGRPYSKDPKSGNVRKIWGELVPFDKVWRLGADEATLLVTQEPLDLGGTALPAGAYTLYLLPAADGSAKLLVNKQIGQWGADIYNEKTEFARVDLKKDTLDPALDQFAMSIEKNGNTGGVIKLGWEKTQYSVTFAVKK